MISFHLEPCKDCLHRMVCCLVVKEPCPSFIHVDRLPDVDICAMSGDQIQMKLEANESGWIRHDP